MEEALIKRVMPNSLEAEQSVVGSMIMDRDAIVAASEILIKEDFYHQQYGQIFEAIVELYNSGQAVDVITLQNKLREKDVPPEVSSVQYISDLVAAIPVTVNTEAYAHHMLNPTAGDTVLRSICVIIKLNVNGINNPHIIVEIIKLNK